MGQDKLTVSLSQNSISGSFFRNETTANLEIDKLSVALSPKNISGGFYNTDLNVSLTNKINIIKSESYNEGYIDGYMDGYVKGYADCEENVVALLSII